MSTLWQAATLIVSVTALFPEKFFAWPTLKDNRPNSASHSFYLTASGQALADFPFFSFIFFCVAVT